MFIGKLVDYAIAALAGATAMQSKEFLSGQHFLIATLVPPLLAVLTFVALNQIHRTVFKNSRRIRQLFSQLAEFEGLWLDKAERCGDTHYGIVELNYNKIDDCHYVSGQSFLESGECTASWHSEPLHLDPKKLIVEYRWEGESRSKAIRDGTNERLRTKGWTCYEIDQTTRNDMIGFFISFNPEPVRRELKLKRLTGEAMIAHFPPESDLRGKLKQAFSDEAK